MRWRDGYGFVLYDGNGQFYVPKSEVIQVYFSFFKVTLAFKKKHLKGRYRKKSLVLSYK